MEKQKAMEMQQMQMQQQTMAQMVRGTPEMIKQTGGMMPQQEEE